MKIYETYGSCRDASNKYFDSSDSGQISYFLSTEYYPNGNANTVDYLNEFQCNFQGVDSTATSKHLIFKTDPDEDADNWKQKDLKEWTSNDVLHWIASVAESQKFPYECINATAFNVDGKTLLSLSKKQFVNSDEKYGSLLFHTLHKSMARYDESSVPTYRSCAKDDLKLETLSAPSHLTDSLIPLANKTCRKAPPFGLVRQHTYTGDSVTSPVSYPFELNPRKDEEIDKVREDKCSDRNRSNSETNLSSDNEQSDSDSKKQGKKSGTVKRSPGRPPGIKSKKEKAEKKTGRLWEFIRDLLLDPQHCPSVICWENHDDGVFRFVKSEKVAKIWGDRKGNEKMNYEKLSRAMRYYYRSKVLQPVLGRRLVYKFGPTARGWKTENPNFRH
ncbi:hypothetical protein RUM44_007577 [Polyplax serrata]|uniref:Uncharacterized protein n=1 Tax=Polyplax serrata TaxID=468196 RepID=A0ABR1B6X2_POLSC